MRTRGLRTNAISEFRAQRRRPYYRQAKDNKMLKIALFLCLLQAAAAFVPLSNPSRTNLMIRYEKEEKGGLFEGVSNFFKELDAFMDDASARRLGNGAAFYGKRRSNFYGEQDRNKKRNRDVSDPTEDYRGPSQAGYFQWMPDENGEMRPVTRMKNKIIEKK